MSTPEKEFITRFLSLATINPPLLASNYKKPLQAVETLGVALPPLRYKYDANKNKNSGNWSDGEIHLSMKSIRPPKFALSRSFLGNNTIYQVKAFIVMQEEAVHDATQLKVLLKGKVLHDNLLLSDLKVSEAQLTVLVAKPEPNAPNNKNETSSTMETSKAKLMVPWKDIRSILLQKLEDETTAQEIFNRLQRGWEVTELP
ncbi:LAMI_0C07778g1_1 [Lachancea mirantina]|uniref:LAMI_0C07778g1_1 n=1 Tax=Lachancea mirantina TaxID=1230905 RepID=A0A1G4J470_9SACH|nr:LAMI_0C07778g1_1 [Lachancea mirantina]